MENAKSGHHAISGRVRNPVLSTEPGSSNQFARTDPRSRAINRSSRAFEYAAFAEAVHRDLDPRGTLERLMVDQVVHSAWKLKASLEKQVVRDRSDKLDPGTETAKVRTRSTELERSARSMKEALESLDLLRTRIRSTETNPLEAREAEIEIFPNEWPIVPCDGLDDFADNAEVPESEEPSWHERLVYDFDVSEASPVVKGTWITVGHVVSLIVDGWSWADILRSHPELTEDDIRTCVAFAMQEDPSAA